MRATEILKGSPLARLRELGGVWGVEAEQKDIIAAMRRDSAADVMRGVCNTPVMREDLALLCSNPFDTVGADEVADATTLQKAGFVHSDGDGGFAVNMDIALALTTEMPFEFGFLATLLARLDGEERATVAKSVSVGPRPSRVDQVFDIAEKLSDESQLIQQVAYLRESDRAVVRRALELGELPDDLSEMNTNASPPMVTLDEGEAGKRGLVFWFEDPERDIDARPVVPIELAAMLPSLLEKVPPPPEVVSGRTINKRERRAAPKKKRAPTTVEALPDVPSATPAVSRNPLASSAAALSASPSAAPGSLRVQRGVNAGGIVDLSSGRAAEAARKDEELGESILEVVADSLIVLRAGIDPRDWAERAALKLGL
ncbi:MAG: hypothetical protein ACJA1R_002646 [Flavobacteriales bacterium]|jgi:hypothetical protein